MHVSAIDCYFVERRQKNGGPYEETIEESDRVIGRWETIVNLLRRVRGWLSKNEYEKTTNDAGLIVGF